MNFRDLGAIVLASLIITLNPSVSYGQHLENSKISLNTNKSQYLSAETVELSISNISQDTVFIYRHSITYESLELEYLVNGNWVPSDICKPIDGEMLIEPFSPKEKIIFEWKQWLNKKDAWPETINAPNGKYRFKLNYWKRNDIRCPIKLANSGQFMEYYFTYSNIFELIPR